MKLKNIVNVLCIALFAVAFGTNIYIAADNYDMNKSSMNLAAAGNTNGGSSNSNGNSTNSNGNSANTNGTSSYEDSNSTSWWDRKDYYCREHNCTITYETNIDTGIGIGMKKIETYPGKYKSCTHVEEGKEGKGDVAHVWECATYPCREL